MGFVNFRISNSILQKEILLSYERFISDQIIFVRLIQRNYTKEIILGSWFFFGIHLVHVLILEETRL
jgi:hypothetical protein